MLRYETWLESPTVDFGVCEAMDDLPDMLGLLLNVTGSQPIGFAALFLVPSESHPGGYWLIGPV